jgi:hypothetical protein
MGVGSIGADSGVVDSSGVASGVLDVVGDEVGVSTVGSCRASANVNSFFKETLLGPSSPPLMAM